MEYYQHTFDKFKGVSIFVAKDQGHWVAYAMEDIPGNHPEHHVIFNDVCDRIRRPSQYAALSAAQWYVNNYYGSPERRKLIINRAVSRWRDLNEIASKLAKATSRTKEALNKLAK